MLDFGKENSLNIFKKSASLVLALFIFLISVESATAQINPDFDRGKSEMQYAPISVDGLVGKGAETTSSLSGGISTTQAGTAYIADAGLNSDAPHVNAQTGAMQYTYTLDVPPGRNGMTPDLTLSYGSNDKSGNSIFGFGWDMSIPSIQRINKTGSQKLYTSSFFESSLDGELLMTSTTTYVSKIENGSFRKYELVNNGWVITEKDGTKYYFGTTVQSRKDDPNDNSRVYSWMLERIQDTNGNFIAYSYYKNAGEIYPDQISYTGNGTTSGIFNVAFTRQSRSDITRSYATDFLATTTYRINEVVVSQNGNWVKKYTLAYSVGQNNTRSVLNSIIESGRDESLSVVTLPAITFSYEKNATSTSSWSTDSSWVIPENFMRDEENYDDGTRQFDVNGDGLVDIVRYWGANLNAGWSYSPNQRVYLNTGSTWATSTEWILPQPLESRMAFVGYDPVNGGNVDLGARFADVNGDGYTDILWGYYANTIGHPQGYLIDINYVYLNNKVNGWSTSTEYQLPSDFRFVEAGLGGHLDPGVAIEDINGDGLPDLIKSFFNGISVKKIYFNTGHGWEVASGTWDLPHPLREGNIDAGTRLADVNGDGLVDVLRYRDSDYNTQVRSTYLNTGSGWIEAPAQWWSPLPFMYQFLNYGNKTLSTRLVDVNGDGLVDIFDNNSAFSVATTAVYINTGSGWVNQTSQWSGYLNLMSSYTVSGYVYVSDLGVRLFDADGDNMLDFVKYYQNDSGGIERQTLIHDGNVPDILKSIQRPEGGTIAIAYSQTALQQDSSGNRLNQVLPQILTVVATTTYNDLINPVYSETYKYAGGSYYFASSTNRQFAGFASSTVTDGSNNFTTSHVHQANGTTTSDEYGDEESKIGKLYRAEQYDANGNLYQQSLSKWEHNASSTGSKYVYKTRDLIRSFDGDGDSRDTTSEYQYNPDNGNLTTLTEWGEVTGSSGGTFSDTGTDKRTTQYGYATNTSAYIVGLPSLEQIHDQSGSKIRESRYYYDTLSLGSIDKGNRTKDENWVSGSTYIDTEKTYNSYGLVTQSKDARDKTTTYSYDTYNLYPATTTNPLSQIILEKYDYTLGKVSTTTDPNNRTYVVRYDGLDRVKEEKVPDPVTGTLVTKTLNTYTDVLGNTSVVQEKFLSSSSSVLGYEYRDGFGRVRQSRTEAEDSNVFVVRDFSYGSNGLLKRESLPYFGNGTASSTATTTNNLHSTYSYDPLKRLKSIATAVGTTTNSYDQWNETVTDANGNTKIFGYDAYGRLTKVTEQNDSNDYETNYTWNHNDKLTNVTDALGNVRNIGYDGIGRRLTLEDLHDSVDTGFGVWYFEYDATGNLSSTTDPSGHVVNYTYDDVSRVLTENYLGQAGDEVSYVYDTCIEGIGRICQVDNRSATTTYTYVPLGLIKSESKTIAGTSYVATTSYDRLGNVIQITYPDSSDVLYVYNAAGQLEKIEQKEVGGIYKDIVSDFEYAPTGLVARQLHGNGVLTEKIYDANELYRLRSINTTIDPPTGGGGVELALIEESLSLSPEGLLLFMNENGNIEILNEDSSSVAPRIQNDVIATTTDESVGQIISIDQVLTDEVVVPQQEITSVEVASTTTDSGNAEVLPESVLTVDVFPAVEVPLEGGKNVLINMGRDHDKFDSSVTISLDNPMVSLSRWDNEVNLGVAYNRVVGSGRHDSQTKFTEWGVGKHKLQAYPLVASEIMEDGGLEIEVVLDEKPESNTFEFQISGTENLDFYYQPPLTKTKYDKSVVCSETECRDAEGEVIEARAENIVGSYAVYHKTKSGYIDGVNYGIGKAFQIFRPKVIDADGKEVWATMNYKKGSLTVTVPTDFLESATYPVRVDPTFGYTSAGGSWINRRDPNGVKAVAPESGTITSLSFYGRAYKGTIQAGAAIYSDNAGAPYTMIAGDTGNISYDATLGWRTININNAPITKDGSYWMMVWPSNYHRYYYDVVTNGVVYGAGAFENWPSPFNNYAYNNYRISVYVTYSQGQSTASGLLAEGLIDPLNVSDVTPEFSAIFHDPDINDYGTHYQIQVASSSTFTNIIWDSTKVALSSSTAQGQRINDVSYGGTLLSSNILYYWRIKFWDNGNAEGIWSTTTATFSLSSGDPQSLVFVSNLQNLGYTYDAVGNITQIVDRSGTLSAATTTYEYDDLYRLVNASTTLATSSPYTQSYTYDALGNILTRSDQGTYTYAETGYANPHAVTSIGGSTYTYDNNGNPTSVTGGTSHSWDYQNRLTQSVVGGATTTYAYDNGGQRVSKSTGAITTKYPFSTYEVAGTTTTKHIYAGGTLVATVKGTGTNSVTYHNHLDHLDSTSAVTDNDGYLNQVTSYRPFGDTRVDQQYGSINQDTQYVGTKHDASTDLNYMSARYADTGRGQFVSQDPVFWKLPKELLSDPQQLNSYSYARNNPIVLKDPSGLLTVIVPGTLNSKKDWSSSGTAKDFISNVGKTFNETPVILDWSGGNSKGARREATDSLTNLVKNHQFAEGEQLNIIGHSHGGNVGILFSKTSDRKIDNLITLGTPVRADYTPNYDMIEKHVNAYSNADPVQKLGGKAFGWGGFGFYGYGFVPAQRTYDGATNVGVTKEAGFPGAHSNLWQNSDVWIQVNNSLKQNN